MANPRSFLEAGIVSLDPLISFTKRHTPTQIGVVGGCPELFMGRPSLHIMASSWVLHDWAIAEIAAEIKRVSQILPQASFLFLGTTEFDTYRLSAAGVPSFVACSSIFVDENVFRPLPPFDGSGFEFDAIYNARMEPYKRHELATRIENLALIYDCRFDGSASPFEASVREWLPNARYLNHELGKGRYLRLDKPTIANELNRARCGLCLSAEEGEMRASMEYLLAGLPIVSTKSLGDRDRYFANPYAIIAPDDPQALADAVLEMKRRKLNKVGVRDHIGRIIGFERNAFLRALNRIVAEMFGSKDLFENSHSFINASVFTEPSKAWSRNKLQLAAEILGVTLPPIAEENVTGAVRA